MNNVSIFIVVIFFGALIFNTAKLSVVTEEDGILLVFRLTVDATNKANKNIALKAEKLLSSLPSNLSPQFEGFIKGATENIITKTSFDLQQINDDVYDYSRQLKMCSTTKCRALVMVKFTDGTTKIPTKIETVEAESMDDFQQLTDDISHYGRR